MRAIFMNDLRKANLSPEEFAKCMKMYDEGVAAAAERRRFDAIRECNARPRTSLATSSPWTNIRPGESAQVGLMMNPPPEWDYWENY